MSIATAVRSHRKTSIVVGVLIALLAGVVLFAAANKIAPVSWGLWGPINASSGLALEGYDPVAYHRDNAAKQGLASISLRWNDIDWHFASEENKSLFQAEPEKYAPRYGGYCAIAVSLGLTADTDPKVWHIQDGKLYLFAGVGPKDDWTSKIEDGVVGRGDSSWASR